jgi:ElaB/YqjD/DUF883 family membrane-anchored ribosome-binding protein
MSQYESRGLTATMSPESGQQSSESDVVTQAQQQVQEKAQQVTSQAGDKVREQVGHRSTQAGEQIQSVGEALRSSGNQLREQGKEGPAKVVDGAAGRIDSLSSYLRDSDADRILDDVESWVRRRPWAAAGIGFLAGFLGSRFLKASSSNRYESQYGDRSQRYPHYGMTRHELPVPEGSLGYPETPAGYESRPGAM